MKSYSKLILFLEYTKAFLSNMINVILILPKFKSKVFGMMLLSMCDVLCQILLLKHSTSLVFSVWGIRQAGRRFDMNH
jgi:hypothetical protein